MHFLKTLSPRWSIVAFSLLVHLPGITSPLLDYHAYRQCQTASMARNYVRHGMHFLNPELDDSGFPERAGTEFPIYSYLLAILFKIVGLKDILGRLLSCLFAAWGAVFLYQFARPRLGEAAAWISGLAMCAIPIHIYFTRSVQPEPMALWGLLGFLHYFSVTVTGDERSAPLGRCKAWIFAVLLGSLAPLLKLPFIYLLVPLWFLLGWEKYRWGLFKQPAVLANLAGILGLTWLWYHYARTAPVTILPLTAAEHWLNIRPIFTLNLWIDHFVSRLPELCTTYPGLLFAIAGAVSLYKEKKIRWAAAWFGATALYIVLLGQYGITHRYTALPFAPVCAVFIATGIAWAWNRWPRALTVVLILGIPLHAGFRIKHWYNLEYPWVFEARKQIAEISTPRDLLITNTREHPVLLYHLDRYGFSPDLEDIGLDILTVHRAQGARLFLTPTEESWSRHPEWSSYFEKNAQLVHKDPNYLIYRFN